MSSCAPSSRRSAGTSQRAATARSCLKGYLQWGIDVLPRLNGMFALAIYDIEQRSLILARDRFGEKPLFWTDWEGGVAFASEIKAAGAAIPGVRLDLDPGAVWHATSSAAGRTSVVDAGSAGIHQLAPGSWIARRRLMDARTGSYFDLDRRSRRRRAGAHRRARGPTALLTAWERSIELRLRSDVPVGTSLSSGVDSAAVLAEAAAIGHERYHAFTLRYDDARDEGLAAEDAGRRRRLRMASGVGPSATSSPRPGTA